MKKFILIGLFCISLMPCQAQYKDVERQVENITFLYADKLCYFKEWMLPDNFRAVDFEDFYIVSLYKDGEVETLDDGSWLMLYEKMMYGSSLESYVTGFLVETYGYSLYEADAIWAKYEYKAKDYLSRLIQDSGKVEALYVEYCKDRENFVKALKTKYFGEIDEDVARRAAALKEEYLIPIGEGR